MPQLALRLTEKEYKHLKKEAEKSGLKMEPFIRKLIMDEDIKPRPTEEYLKVVRELNAIGNNINQIARKANAENHISQEDVDKATKLIDRAMDIVRGSDIWQ